MTVILHRRVSTFFAAMSAGMLLQNPITLHICPTTKKLEKEAEGKS